MAEPTPLAQPTPVDPAAHQHRLLAVLAERIERASAAVLRTDGRHPIRDWRRSALTDDLTGLPNRRALLAEIDRRQAESLLPLTLVFVDLDHFKLLNDHLGHTLGDVLLVGMAQRFLGWLGSGDFAARLSGDEFVVLLGPDHGAEGEAAHELLGLIGRPVQIGGRYIVHTGSIGVVGCDGPRPSGLELLHRADVAMYTAKARGRNRIVVFDEELVAWLAERSETALLLRQGWAEGELSVYYQPEFDQVTGRLTAFEALVRWHHPTRGLLEAVEFIHVAEESHFLPDLGQWVLATACDQLAQWREDRPDLEVTLRVNASPTELAVPAIAERIEACLVEAGVPPELLCLEITEQATAANPEPPGAVLRRLRSIGVQLAIDDFGVGYSSLLQLKNLPVNIIKIDRAFVDGVATDPINQGIVQAIVQLGRTFQLQVVAEGVETTEDLDELRRLGVHRIQGFVFQAPLTAEEARALVLAQ